MIKISILLVKLILISQICTLRSKPQLAIAEVYAVHVGLDVVPLAEGFHKFLRLIHLPVHFRLRGRRRNFCPRPHDQS